jgi:hypothetical protein
MNEVVGRGYVKKPKGRPPKVDSRLAVDGIPTVEDITLDKDLFDVEDDVSIIPDQAKTQSEYVTPRVSRQKAAHFGRLEEVENALVKSEGRYISHVDDAKAGVPYKQTNANDPLQPFLEGIQGSEQVFMVPLINQLNIRADGFVSEGGMVLDTGAGAQEAVSESANPHEPSSKAFMVCVNKTCNYREGCLRYRLSNRRDNKFPFHPSECRADGIYISINDSKFTGYDPFNVIDAGGLPDANRW